MEPPHVGCYEVLSRNSHRTIRLIRVHPCPSVVKTSSSDLASTNSALHATLRAMATNPESPLDLLWKEYGHAFREFDDLTLARWLAQTLGQLEGKVWRLSHPLLGAYRLAAQLAHERQVWLKRLATPPAAYSESECCRAPLLPLFTRDVLEAGLMCQHCNELLFG